MYSHYGNYSLNNRVTRRHSHQILSLSIVSKQIITELSSVATYTILFTNDGECPGTSSFTLLLIQKYNSCRNFLFQATIGTVTPTIRGTSGTFTVSPTGLIIDPLTGIITPELSSIATYTILFTGDEMSGLHHLLLVLLMKRKMPILITQKFLIVKGLLELYSYIIGVVSGTFTASPTGLIIDPITGIITPELSSIATIQLSTQLLEIAQGLHPLLLVLLILKKMLLLNTRHLLIV